MVSSSLCPLHFARAHARNTHIFSSQMSAILPIIRGSGHLGVAGFRTVRNAFVDRQTTPTTNVLVGSLRRLPVRNYAAAGVTKGTTHNDVAHGVEKTPREEDIEYMQTMDFLPSPAGPWQEGYDKQQKKFNLTLAAGVVFFLASWAVGPLLADDMYELYYYPQDFLRNPPPFSMSQVAAEALARLEPDDDE